MNEQQQNEFQLDDGTTGRGLAAPRQAATASYSYHSDISSAADESSNLLLGLIGAVIGAIPGCILWIVIGYIGFVAGIAGYAIMFGAMFCYEKLGKTLDKKGIIICIIVTLISILFANVLGYAIEIYKYAAEEGMEPSFFLVLINTPMMIKEAGMLGGFLLNLAIGYGLTVWSCSKFISSMFK